ncbi:unnamed protein product, partial [Mesorhabditis belari]|uniref:Uncharacterized protein n=1 Tax=Mesorhabditis belari TaxID=2138241 RepID=A0AAF3EYP6_9BILA
MEMTGDAGFGFLRDNPFIKNDAAHRRVTNFRQIRGHSPRNLQEKPSFATVTLKSVQLNRPESTSPMPPSNNSKQQSERKNDASNLREISRSADPQSHKANKQQKMKNDLPLPQNSNLLKAAKKADREERASNGPNSEFFYLYRPLTSLHVDAFIRISHCIIL